MKIHIARSGDTLYTLAKTYHVDLEKLITCNSHLATPDDIRPGMKIIIPSMSVKLKKDLITNPSENQKTTRLLHTSQKTSPITEIKNQNTKTPTSGNNNLIFKKKARMKKPEVQTSTKKDNVHSTVELQFQLFTPHKRMEVDMETDFEKRKTQKLKHDKASLQKGNIAMEKDIYCHQCQHPMRIEQPVYFPEPTYKTKGTMHKEPYIPSDLLRAKPTKFLS